MLRRVWPTRLWTPWSFPSTARQGTRTADIPRFGELRWQLAALHHGASGRSQAVNWEGVPVSLRAGFMRGLGSDQPSDARDTAAPLGFVHPAAVVSGQPQTHLLRMEELRAVAGPLSGQRSGADRSRCAGEVRAVLGRAGSHPRPGHHRDVRHHQALGLRALPAAGGSDHDAALGRARCRIHGLSRRTNQHGGREHHDPGPSGGDVPTAGRRAAQP
jgi:hypothetical protein